LAAAEAGGLRIVELARWDPHLPQLDYSYTTTGYYDVVSTSGAQGWRIELALKSFDGPVEKAFSQRMFEAHVEEPRAFAAVLGEEQVGWVEVGYERWNNRARIWQLLVREGFRRRGVGSLLMARAVEVAREKGARMLALETQSCNVPAISFYLKQGFVLIGLDSAAYSNSDVERREVRLELGLAL
jgi:ribosomal protein S18 acetylase RimI-like enzyme